MATAAPALKTLGKLAQSLPLGEGEGSQGGPPVDQPQPNISPPPPPNLPTPAPIETPPPNMAPGLGTTGGAPIDADSQAKPPPETPVKAPAKDANPAYPGAIPDDKPKPEAKAHPGYPGAVPDEPSKPETKPAYPGAIPDSGSQQPVAVPQPTPVVPPPLATNLPPPQVQSLPIGQQPLQIPTPTPEAAAPDPHEQLQVLIAQGHSPGAAQAIINGQQPKTISGDKPAPLKQPATPAPSTTTYIAPPLINGKAPAGSDQSTTQALTPPKAADTLKAEGNTVTPVALYSYLLGKFAHSGLVGYVPPDGARWGIKTGSAAEWAAFGLAVAKQESDLNIKSFNAADPGGSAGLFQFGQAQKPYVQGDQFDPQQSADAFVRAVQHYLANKGSIANLGETFGSIRRPNEAGQYIAGAEKVAAGGDGKDLVSSGGGGNGKLPAGQWPTGGVFAGQPLFSIGSQQSPAPAPAPSQGAGPFSDTGGAPLRAPQEESGGGGGGAFLGGAAAGALAANAMRGGSQQSIPDEPPTPINPTVAALIARGFSPTEAQNMALGMQTVAPGKGVPPLSPKTPAAPPEAPGVPRLPAPSGTRITPKLLPTKALMPGKVPPIVPKQPPAAPSAGPDPSVIKGLMQRGFTREQALAVASKATVSPPGAPTGSASFRPPAQQPPAKAPPAPAAPAPEAKPAAPQSQVEGPPPTPAKQPKTAPVQIEASDIRPLEKKAASEEPTEFTGAPSGSTRGNPTPAGHEGIFQPRKLVDQALAHAGILSPDDPRVKKQSDGYIKGEHFVEGDPWHDDMLNKLPYGKQGRQRNLLGQGEQAISDSAPMHISYISSPKEAEKFPTRESRKMQYEEFGPDARQMGLKEGQLVGHSMIPVSVGIKLPKDAEAKRGVPHQGYIQGISTNVMANNFQHINDKLEAMGRKTPYKKLGPKFYNDLEGFFHNLLGGHTATGSGYAVGTPDHPNEPDRTHVPYMLTRKEADFIGAVINNTAAFAKHEDAEKIRQLARANGTLITPEGETNRLLHDIEQHEPGWTGRINVEGKRPANRVLEPSIMTFRTGLIHEVHPTEEHMPESIRPGKEYQELTKALARITHRGMPAIAIGASLHHTFQDNKKINEIERDFSDHKIDEATARARLQQLGEDPNDYRFVGGSGGLITPYEDDPESITPEEHQTMKDNLRQSWVSGKMNVEDYRKKSAEVPLPSKPSQPKPAKPVQEQVSTPAPKPPKVTPEPEPKPITPVTPPKPKPQPEPETPEPEEKPATPAPKPPKPPQEAPEAPSAPAPAPAKEKPSKPAPEPTEEPEKRMDPSRVTNKVKSDQVHFLPTKDVDQRWKSGHAAEGFYIPPGGTKNTIGQRYENAKQHVQSDASMHAPEVAVWEDGTVHFSDGRHRYAAMRDLGHTHVPMALSDESVENAKKTGLIKGEAEEPKKKAPPAPDEPIPEKPAEEAPAVKPKKAKKAQKSPEQIAAEKEDLRQADIHRKTVTPERQAARDEIQRAAQQALAANPESDPLSAHHYINGHATLPDWIKTKEHIGKHFDEVNPKLDYAKDEHRQRAADALTHDVLHGLSKNSSAYDWYDDTVDKSLNHIGQVAPKILTHKDHEMAFKLATAITSQGQDVFPNFESGYLGYRHWHKTGKLPEDPAIFGGGTKAQAMVANFKKVNRLWKELGHEGLRDVLEKQMTMRELRDKYGIKLAGESPDHVMEGAAMLGPKIGSFYNNLNKRFHSTTFDLWATRNLNRIAGRMLKFSPNSLLKDKVTKKGPKPGQLSRLDALLANGNVEGADAKQQKAMRAESAALRKLKNATRERVLEVAPTIAEWAGREHGRYAKGTGGRSYPKELKSDSTSLAKNMDLNLTDLADAPRGPKQRQQFRDIYKRTQDNLAKHGIDMTHASNQAVLWFIEQKLFQMGGSRNRASFDYLDASHRLVRKIKSGELPALHGEEPALQAA